MTRDTRTIRRSVACVVVAVLAAGPALADEWLVYLGGGLEPIEGGWTERHGRVIFTKAGGTLVSVPYAEVDLATSAFISWQLGGRLQVPPRSPLPDAPAEGNDAGDTPCTPARVLGLLSGETLRVTTTGDDEVIVHVACLDTPETQHRFAELGWFGRATLSAVEIVFSKGNEICMTEQAPPRRDLQQHPVVYVTLADGRDYAATIIASGLGLLRPGPCGRAAFYRSLEDDAIAGERGLWSARGANAAFAAASHSVAVGTGAPSPRSRRGGGG